MMHVNKMREWEKGKELKEMLQLHLHVVGTIKSTLAYDVIYFILPFLSLVLFSLLSSIMTGA